MSQEATLSVLEGKNSVVIQKWACCASCAARFHVCSCLPYMCIGMGLWTFSTKVAGFQCADEGGILKGKLINGTQIKGSDKVSIAPCN